MIIDGLISLISAVIRFGAEFLPTWGFDQIGAFTANFGLVVSAFQSINYFIPLGEVAVAVLAVFAVMPLFLGSTLVLWLIALLRGGSARA